MRICVLAENRALPGFEAEHGFACLVERDGATLLFDTGASGLLLRNAATLGLDPARARACVISHGHYDHTGGMRALLDAGFRGPVISGEGLFAERWAAEEPRWRSIGSRFSYEDIAGNGHRVLDMGKPEELLPGVYALAGFSSPYPEEAPNPRFRIGGEGSEAVDGFEGEACLVIDRGAEGLLMIAGCSHPGIAGMATRVKDVLGKAPRAILGGFHLSAAPEARVEATLARLEALGVEELGPCHCSGEAIIGKARESDSGVIDAKAGSIIEPR
jgi:7,8-dihydropterin-6-yl-methyl-4-(beta-D-ribofuranosyl)aminobenzene 5'-phosphate synthase